MKYGVFALLAMAIVISFLGFCLENAWLAYTKGFVDNRNFSLPFLAGYGILVLGIYFIIGTPEEMRAFAFFDLKTDHTARVILYFADAFLTVSIAEVILGTVFEKATGVIWWDYTRLPLHFTRYTSVFTSMGFALVITLFMDNVFTPLMDRIMLIDPVTLRNNTLVVSLFIFIDTLNSFRKMYRSRSLNVTWRYYIADKRLERVK